MVAVHSGDPQAVNLLWQHRANFDINHRNKVRASDLHSNVTRAQITVAAAVAVAEAAIAATTKQDK